MADVLSGPHGSLYALAEGKKLGQNCVGPGSELLKTHCHLNLFYGKENWNFYYFPLCSGICLTCHFSLHFCLSYVTIAIAFDCRQ